MIRTKGEAGTGDVIQAVKHARTIHSQIQATVGMDDNQLRAYARKLGVMFELLKKTAKLQRLPVVNFAAGGVGGLKLIVYAYNYQSFILNSHPGRRGASYAAWCGRSVCGVGHL